MRKLRGMVERLAPLSEPVLVLGPSGAGKELVARALHEGSPRQNRPFVPVNCAILSASADLAHDRLFGHAAGAFTGATGSEPGAFEAADGGTLFLDEIGELPLEVQTSLLRVLEEGTVLPAGTMNPRPVDVRIVAATNQPLARMVSGGRFRLDLYHRLNVLCLRVPALRERAADIKTIARSVQRDLKLAGHPLSIGTDDWAAMRGYAWPGNVRQLINILKRAAYMGLSVREAIAEEAALPGGEADGDETEEALRLFRPASADLAEPEEAVRRDYMRHVFSLCGGNYAQAAETLGVAVNTLRKWIGDGKGGAGE